jgi:hypothetical protein
MEQKVGDKKLEEYANLLSPAWYFQCVTSQLSFLDFAQKASINKTGNRTADSR